MRPLTHPLVEDDDNVDDVQNEQCSAHRSALSCISTDRRGYTHEVDGSVTEEERRQGRFDVQPVGLSFHRVRPPPGYDDHEQVGHDGTHAGHSRNWWPRSQVAPGVP